MRSRTIATSATNRNWKGKQVIEDPIKLRNAIIKRLRTDDKEHWKVWVLERCKDEKLEYDDIIHDCIGWVYTQLENRPELPVGIAIYRAIGKAAKGYRFSWHGDDLHSEYRESERDRPAKKRKKRFTLAQLREAPIPWREATRQYGDCRIADHPKAIMDEHLCYRVNVD